MATKTQAWAKPPQPKKKLLGAEIRESAQSSATLGALRNQPTQTWLLGAGLSELAAERLRNQEIMRAKMEASLLASKQAFVQRIGAPSSGPTQLLGGGYTQNYPGGGSTLLGGNVLGNQAVPFVDILGADRGRGNLPVQPNLLGGNRGMGNGAPGSGGDLLGGVLRDIPGVLPYDPGLYDPYAGYGNGGGGGGGGYDYSKAPYAWMSKLLNWNVNR